jgi:hypothetical protein
MSAIATHSMHPQRAVVPCPLLPSFVASSSATVTNNCKTRLLHHITTTPPHPLYHHCPADPCNSLATDCSEHTSPPPPRNQVDPTPPPLAYTRMMQAYWNLRTGVAQAYRKAGSLESRYKPPLRTSDKLHYQKYAARAVHEYAGACINTAARTLRGPAHGALDTQLDQAEWLCGFSYRPQKGGREGESRGPCRGRYPRCEISGL